MSTMSLKEKLKEFRDSYELWKVDKLTEEFNELANAFLYGGYFNVDNRYRIYIRTVEFYFHSEEADGEHDPIVYHRNNRYVKGEVPYFPLMALHAHTSGVDVTFESENNHYRASALIRAYEIYDLVEEDFLVYDSESKMFMPLKELQAKHPTKTIKQYNVQSTYVYNFLNGFTQDAVNWVDLEYSEHEKLEGSIRKNVFMTQSEDENNVYFISKEKSKEIDERKWSFTREEDVMIDL